MMDAKKHSKWLLDAVATATQDRRLLRDDPSYDAVLGEAILLNAEKAISAALEEKASYAVPPDRMGTMRRASEMIAELQDILKKFGDTCIYVRRGGLAWGALALTREYADRNRRGDFSLSNATEALTWIRKVASDEAKGDAELKARGARTLQRIADRAGRALGMQDSSLRSPKSGVE